MNPSPQVSKGHYFDKNYNHKARWMSYFYQMDILRGLNVKNILEVGKGNGWTANILRETGMSITTSDIDETLKPDVVASVEKLPFSDETFDAACAFEVLEHLPFERFGASLKELSRVSKKYVIISLPDKRRTLFHCLLKLPFMRYKNLFIRIPSFKEHVFDGQHYWEIGKTGYPVSSIKKQAANIGLKIKKDFVCFDAPSNHYFIFVK